MREITLPLSEKIVETLQVGEAVLLSGTMYTGRDAAHKKLYELLQAGRELPVELRGELIYYAGPAPARPGEVIGPVGPTSSYRMDKFTPALLEYGMKGMIGKGRRTKEVIESIVKNKAIYFVAIGGAAALLAEQVKSAEIVCYEELGTESIMKLKVEKFPVFVGVDSKGNSIY